MNINRIVKYAKYFYIISPPGMTFTLTLSEMSAGEIMEYEAIKKKLKMMRTSSNNNNKRRVHKN